MADYGVVVVFLRNDNFKHYKKDDGRVTKTLCGLKPKSGQDWIKNLTDTHHDYPECTACAAIFLA